MRDKNTDICYNIFMKINLSKEDLKKLDYLLQIKEQNMSIAELYFSTFDQPTYFNEKNVIRLMKKNDCSETEAILSLILSYSKIDRNSIENKKIINSIIRPSIKELNIDKYLKNPYYNSIKLSNIEQKGVEIENLSFEPYELIPIGEITVDYPNGYLERTNIGYFKSPLPYLAISKNKTIWMSITPSEIDSMEKEIKEAKGKVITFGLGLGYYAYMVSLKNDVESVTIVDNDDDIIDLFLTYILPQFEFKNKIHVVKSDAFKFLTNSLQEYDYAYFDLWHSPTDGLMMYLKIKPYEKKNPHTKFAYWLNESIEAMYRRCKLTLLEEQLNQFDEQCYIESSCETDTIINTLYEQTKNTFINTYEDVLDFLNNN